MTKSNRGGVRQGAGRPKSEETKMMRIPVGAESLVKHLISVYKKLDSSVIHEIITNSASHSELQASAVLLQLADPDHFCHTRRLKQHLFTIELRNSSDSDGPDGQTDWVG